MNCLLLYPRFPRSFWSFDGLLDLVDRNALLPPLGLVTVAALLPVDCTARLVDRNLREVTSEEWDWADFVLISAMVAQRDDFLRVVHEAKKRGKHVLVGGPLPSSAPELAEEADYQVLDEGEITIPQFLAAFDRGAPSGRFRSQGETADITRTPVPRFELLDLDAYHSMSVQYSRGCPFHCGFCNTGTVHGRHPRTKTPSQLLAELEHLYGLGWRRTVFIADDNLIGNRRQAKEMLRALESWQIEHGFPFTFSAEASVDVAEDEELLRLLVACGFETIALGVETPDEASLARARKKQNLRQPLHDSVDTIIRSGLRPMAGFIIGFDDEQPGAGRRITRFLEETSIPVAVISMLQALPNTPLWERLERDGRLLRASATLDGAGALDAAAAHDPTVALVNFEPTRSIEQIAHEYITAVYLAYDPPLFLQRTYRCFRKMGPPAKRPNTGSISFPRWVTPRALARVMWRHGVRARTRSTFWKNLLSLWFHNRPRVLHYLVVCAQSEHLSRFRHQVLHRVQRQLTERMSLQQAPSEPSALTAALEALRERHARDLERMES